MSAAASIIGQCEECCDCPAPTLEWDSVSAIGNKMGVREAVAYASTPPKIYKKVSYSGANDDDSGPTLHTRVEFSGEANVTFPPYTGYSVSLLSTGVQDNYSAIGDCSAPVSFTSTSPLGNASLGGNYYFVDAGSSTLAFASVAVGPPTYTNATTATWGPGSCTSEIVTTSLSDEYLTSALKTNTVAALPAYDDDWNDTAGSYANLSTDEITYSIRESRYRFRFKIPKVGFGTCYKLTWIERFTPEAGGSPTDTPRCIIWDGVTPSGYDPDTPSTYPILGDGTNPYFSVPIPTSDGTTTVENVVAECLRCTACP